MLFNDYVSFQYSFKSFFFYIDVPCRRKRGEKGEVVETIEDVIVRRLTAERIEELKRLIKDTQEKYRCEMVICFKCSHAKIHL